MCGPKSAAFWSPPRAPRQGARLHVCSLRRRCPGRCSRRRHSGRRPARSSRVAPAHTPARTSVRARRHACGLRRRRTGRRNARSTGRDLGRPWTPDDRLGCCGHAKALSARSTQAGQLGPKDARVLAHAVPCSGAPTVAPPAHRGRRWLLRWRAPQCAPRRDQGCTGAVSRADALAVALLAHRGQRWLLRGRAPPQGARLHVRGLGRRRSGRRPARSSRAAPAPTLARTSARHAPR